MKKILALALALSLLIFAVPAHAATTGEHGAVVSVDTYTEVTDVDALANYALALYGAKDGITPFAMPFVPSHITAEQTAEGIQLNQLLERRIYADGTVEERRATTALLLIDEEGREMTFDDTRLEQVVSPRVQGPSATGSNYNVAVATTIYYGIRSTGDPIRGGFEYQFNYIATVVGANPSFRTVNFYHSCEILKEHHYIHTNGASIYGAATGVPYTLYCTASGWITLNGYFGDSLQSIVDVTVVGYGQFDVMVQLMAAAL